MRVESPDDGDDCVDIYNRLTAVRVESPDNGDASIDI